jgi:hypothetical protein
LEDDTCVAWLGYFLTISLAAVENTEDTDIAAVRLLEDGAPIACPQP